MQFKVKPVSVLILLLGSALLSGCHVAPAHSQGPPPPGLTSNNANSAAVKPPAFNADFAFTMLKDQVAFGPRVLGTTAHHKCLAFLTKEMKKYADSTVLQQFKYKNLRVTNIIGVINGKGRNKPSKHPILLLAHWDTRPVADGPNSTATKDGPFIWGANGWNRIDPIPGANDGASGVGVLLELARMFHKNPPASGVLLLLDDGEDYGDFRADGGKGDGVVLGAEYFATHYQDNPVFGQPAEGILLDMIGGKDMKIYPEVNSMSYDPDLCNQIFQIADSLGYNDIFSQDQQVDVDDDHITINEQGHIPTIDLIQPLPGPGSPPGSYKPWHTIHDDVAHCSKKSLEAVGNTVATYIYSQSS